MFTETISYSAAFIAGLLSFLSPCILPLIPAYFTFITGLSLDEMTNSPDAAIRKKVISSTLAYVLGFSFIFTILGASASWLGNIIAGFSKEIMIIGGSFVIILGIHLTGWLRIPGLDIEKRIHIKKRPVHILGCFMIGMAFGAGWSPCIGPLLGSILILASNQDTVWKGASFLAVYSAGVAIPFIMISFFINFLLVFIKKGSRYLKYVNITAGLILISIGILMIGKII